jgi:hypothetical protein
VGRHMAAFDWMVPLQTDHQRGPLDLKGIGRSRSNCTDSLSVLFLATGSGSEGRGEMEEILTGELGFRRQIPARAHWWFAPASFWLPLVDGETMTMIRETRRVPSFDPRCRLFPVEERRGGWRTCRHR